MQKTYEIAHSFNAADYKKLERLEKLTRRIRNEVGGSQTDADPKELPRTKAEAVPLLADMAKELCEEVEKTPRRVVSAASGFSPRSRIRARYATSSPPAVTRGADGLPRVERVVCAVDCGIAVNPDVVRAQMEGSIGFGLGTALWSEITVVDGLVQQSNFHDFRILRIDEMPRVEVHIVPSAAPPTGVGEPGVPPIAPAVCNAIFALTGKRIRRLPIGKVV